jgi:D-alanine-D-alanine ligase
MNVLVVYGGLSAERDVSLLSGSNVVEALQSAGHRVSVYDPKIDDKIEEHTSNIDVVFPILHGRGGEDGQIQKILEILKIPFVGSGSASSSACFNKWQTIQKLPDVLFPLTELVDYNKFINSAITSKPYVVKPIDEGSSIDTFIIRKPLEFVKSSLKEVFKKYKIMMLEELIVGTEFTVPILIDKALPVVEIIPPIDQEFDFANKYNGATTENCPPKNLSIKVQKLAQQIALDVHRSMDCKSFSRTDFIATPNNKIYALEINTLPGMTKQSLFPKSTKEAGISIEELVDLLVKDAADRS